MSLSMLSVLQWWFFLLGLIVGSFGNVLIVRLPKDQSIRGRSRCIECGRTLRVWELIPVLSYLVLRGKCARCRKTISIRYPLVEIGTGLVFMASLWLAQDLLPALALATSLWALLLIALIDARTQLIPDALSIAAVSSAAVFHLLTVEQVPILAPSVAGLFFFAQWVLSRGRWVGSGDVFLGVAIGMLLGDPFLTFKAVMLSYMIGAVTAIALLASKKVHRKQHIPFGPFLVMSAFFILAWQYIGEAVMVAIR